MRPFQKILLDCAISAIKLGILGKRILLFLFRGVIDTIAWAAGLLFKRPLVFLYKIHLKFRARLGRFGVIVKNPFLTIVSSKTALHLLLIGIGVTAATSQLAYREAPPDILNPKNILSRLIPRAEDEQIVIEEESLLSDSTDVQYSPVSGVRPSAETTATEEERDTRILPGDIAVNTGALIKPILPSTAERVEKPSAIQFYAVQEGDTLGGIAGRFGLKVSTLLAANNLSAYSTLGIGQRLTILPRDGIVYRIRPGDTLGTIAHTFQTTADKIIALNTLPSDRLRIGATLIIPDAVVPVPSRTIASAGAPRTIVGRLKNLLKPAPRVSIPRITGAGMIWPTSARRITQYFSWRHSGVDIAGPTTNRILAAADGRVIIAGWQRGYGLTVVVDHGGGKKTRYAHASRLFVGRGEYVAQGETIAMVGSTGRSTGPHLHFEVTVGGRRVNPFSFIR